MIDKNLNREKTNMPVLIRFRIDKYSYIGILLVLIILILFFSFLSPYFLTVNNLMNIAIRASLLLVISVGMTLVIVGGGIDLSVGSVAVLSSIILATQLRDYGMDRAAFSVLIALITGCAMGFLNGAAISIFRVNPFIITMGTMVIARSLAEMIGVGVITDVPQEFSNIFSYNIFGIVPLLVIIAVFVAIIGHILLSHTVFGANVRGVGSNPRAAAYCGISLFHYRLFIFIINGLIAGLVGVLLVGRTGSATPGGLVGFELEAIAAPVIGGASFGGGKGTILGTVIGVFIIGVIANGLNLLRIEAFWQIVVQGLIILFAASLDYLSQKKAM